METIINVGLKGCLISIASINFKESLVRQQFNDAKLVELSQSIKEKGILQPLLIRADTDKKGKYRVVIGMRRLRAAKLAGLKEVPCIMYEADDKNALQIALTENIQRDDLSPFEEALAIVKLMKEYKYSVRDICKSIGKGDTYVRGRIKMLSLCEDVQQLIVSNKLGFEHATFLVGFGPEEQIKLANEIVDNTLTRDEALNLINEQMSAKKDGGKGGNKANIKPARYAVRGSKDWKGRFKRNNIYVTPTRVELQIKSLTSVISGADFSKFSHDEAETIKAKLMDLQRLINKSIITINCLT